MAAPSIIHMNHREDNSLGNSSDSRSSILDKAEILKSLVGKSEYATWAATLPSILRTPMDELESLYDAKISEREALIDRAQADNGRIDALKAELSECNIYVRALEIEEALASLGVDVAQEMRDKMIGDPRSPIQILRDLDDADTYATLESVRPL